MKNLIIENMKQFQDALDKRNNLVFKGNIVFKVNVKGVKNIRAGGYIIADGEIRADGYIIAGGQIRADGYISAGGQIRADGDIIAGGEIIPDGDIIADGEITCKTLTWARLQMPKAKKINCAIVIPPCDDLTHWEERLGIDCSGDKKEALIRNAPELKKLIGRKCWSNTERWMISSWIENGFKLLEEQA